MTPDQVAKERKNVVNPGDVRSVPRWMLFRGHPGSNRDMSKCGTLADVRTKPGKAVLPKGARKS